MPTKKYHIHPLAQLFPEIEGSAFDALVEDIKARGQQEAAWLIEVDKILDGKNRYRACQQLGIELQTRVYGGNDPIGFVLTANLHRRHLDTSQRAMIAANLCDLGVGANQHTGEGTSIEVSAKLLNVGRASVERALVVLKSGDQELVDAVKSGEVSVGGAVSQLSEAPPTQPESDVENTGGGTKKPRTRKKPQTQTGKVKIEYKKPNDTKTVLSACALHKNHLLDLLEDLSEVSSFDHAEVIAEQVKEEVDRKISHLRSAQDEEQTEEKEEEAVE